MVKTPTLAFSTFVILGKQNPKLRIKVNHHLNHAARTRNVKPTEKKEYASGMKLEKERLYLITAFYEYLLNILERI